LTIGGLGLAGLTVSGLRGSGNCQTEQQQE